MTNFFIRFTIAAIYIVGGWVFFKMNYADYQRIEGLKGVGMEIQGVVTDIHQSPFGAKPSVEFQTTENKVMEFKGLTSEGMYPGATVPVKYNPSNGQAATMVDIERYPVSLPHSVFGSAIFCAICVGVAFFTLTSKKFIIQLR